MIVVFVVECSISDSRYRLRADSDDPEKGVLFRYFGMFRFLLDCLDCLGML